MFHTDLRLRTTNTQPYVSEEVVFTAQLTYSTFFRQILPLFNEQVALCHNELRVYDTFDKRYPEHRRKKFFNVQITDYTHATDIQGKINWVMSWPTHDKRTYYAVFAGHELYDASTSGQVRITVVQKSSTKLSASWDYSKEPSIPYPGYQTWVELFGYLQETDSGKGIPGAVIGLYWENGEPVMSGDKPVTTTTDANGYYKFGGYEGDGVISLRPLTTYFAGDDRYAEAWAIW